MSISTRCILVMLLACAGPASAQYPETRFHASRDTVVRARAAWTPLRVAKWSTLLASTSAAAYGFVQNRSADRDYEDIERICQQTSSSCDRKPGSDVYADPALEARYQGVVSRDNRARVSLLAGQVGLAASVLLFIFDLPKSTGPHDIPYKPPPLHVGFTADQMQVSVRLAFRWLAISCP